MGTQVASYFFMKWNLYREVTSCLSKQNVWTHKLKKFTALKDCDQREMIRFDCICLLRASHVLRGISPVLQVGRELLHGARNRLLTGRDRLRLTALTTNHHGGGAKRRSCTFVVYRETRQRQHTWSRTHIVVHAVQLMWGIIWNFTTELLCIKAVKISAGSS